MTLVQTVTVTSGKYDKRNSSSFFYLILGKSRSLAVSSRLIDMVSEESLAED